MQAHGEGACTGSNAKGEGVRERAGTEARIAGMQARKCCYALGSSPLPLGRNYSYILENSSCFKTETGNSDTTVVPTN